MSENWYPVISTDGCTNCEKCLDVCASSVFELNNSKVTVEYPEDCIFECRKCEGKCPEGALMYELDCEA